MQDGGQFVIPFGHWHSGPKADLLAAMKETEEGGQGFARAFEE